MIVELFSRFFGPDISKLLEYRQFDEIKRLASVDKRVVPKIVRQLSSKQAQLRERAAILLGEMNEPRALPALVEVIKLGIDANRPITNKYSYDVHKYLDVDRYVDTKGYERTIPVFEWAFQDYPGSDRIDVNAAREALEKIVNSRDFGPLLACLKNSNPEVRKQTAEVIMRRSQEIRAHDIEEAVKGLIAISEQDMEPLVRRNARLALRNMGSEAVEPLILALNASRGEKRFYIAWTLYWLWDTHHDKAAIDRIIAGMVEKDTAVVGGAYYYFMEKAEASAEPILEQALMDYGELSPQMVKDFLNCGNARLEDAARCWAANHGFIIESSEFATERSWGSRRRTRR